MSGTVRDFEVYLPIPHGLPEEEWRPIAARAWRGQAQETGTPTEAEPHTIEIATPPAGIAEAIRRDMRGYVSDADNTEFAHVVGQVIAP